MEWTYLCHFYGCCCIPLLYYRIDCFSPIFMPFLDRLLYAFFLDILLYAFFFGKTALCQYLLIKSGILKKWFSFVYYSLVISILFVIFYKLNLNNFQNVQNFFFFFQFEMKIYLTSDPCIVPLTSNCPCLSSPSPLNSPWRSTLKKIFYLNP